jgi:regulatory protein
VPLVTALRATRRGGVALHVDGAFACTVSESLVARWHLYQGRELDEDALAELRAAASAERVMGDAYRLLGHRARSTAELRRRLLQKEHEEAAIDDAVERLTAEGLLDDEAFARSYVADKRDLQGWGCRRIRGGLRELGVDGAIADQVLAEGEGGDELDRALAVLRRRGAPQPPLDAARRRAYQALLRRGFAAAVAYAAVRSWAAADQSDPN